jgi:hypothetical protein
MFKTTTITALTALTLSATAHAGSGIALDSIIVHGDQVRVQYSSKIRSCGILIDEDGYKAQSSPRLFCAPGVDNARILPTRAVDVVAGEAIQMCAQADLSNCTDLVVVRAAGDVNGDGAHNVLDLMIMHSEIMGGDTGSWPTNDEDLLAADMNFDGEVNVIDILLLIEAIKGNDW